MLIDFDYAALAPPLLDLASVSVMNEFAPAEETLLLNAYGADTESKTSMAEFARVKRLIRLLGHFWSMAASDAGAAIVSQYRMDDV
jgi:thiamine kinase-like enzyme